MTPPPEAGYKEGRNVAIEYPLGGRTDTADFRLLPQEPSVKDPRFAALALLRHAAYETDQQYCREQFHALLRAIP
jgi:hypothetical protein